MAGDLRKPFCSQHVFWSSTGSKGECALYKPENVGRYSDPGGMLQSSAAVRLGSGGRADTEKIRRKRGASESRSFRGKKRPLDPFLRRSDLPALYAGIPGSISGIFCI